MVFHTSSALDTSRIARWAAFFGDVDHAVEDVLWGDRVTLTWVIRRGEGAARDTARSDSMTDALMAALRRALEDDDFFADGGTLGFACEHMYAEVPGFVRAVPELTPTTVLRLKGRDQHVAAAMLGAGVAVQLRPYVIEEACYLYWELSRYPNARELSVFDRYRITDDAIQRALPVACGPDDEDVRWVLPPLADERKASGKSLAVASKHLGNAEYSHTGYFGNEGSDGEFYLHGALLVEVPDAESRARAREKRARKASARPAKTRAAKTSGAKTDAAVTDAPKPAPDAREHTAAELRALGHSPAALKRMLADGVVERIGSEDSPLVVLSDPLVIEIARKINRIEIASEQIPQWKHGVIESG